MEDARATVQLVYREVNALRTEMLDRLGQLDAKLEDRFAALLDAIEALRGSVVTGKECTVKHTALQEALASAVDSSRLDRERLWQAVHAHDAALDETQKLVYKLAGAAAAVSAAASAVISHFLR